MTKTLYVPDYLKDQLEKNKPQTEDLKLKERLPQPTGWRVLVMPYKGREKTEGGIHLPDAVRDREALATVVAYVLKTKGIADTLLHSSSMDFASEYGFKKNGDAWKLFDAGIELL